tara:strand:+ start:3070 stop:3444 length:375 start_codon:yes stop_codon:yes gene_type:complete
METNMKAILIDVKNQLVKEVEHDDTLDNIYELIDCRTFDVVSIDGKNSIYVDDEGLYREDQLYFEYFGTEHSVRLAGNGLILGLNRETGDSISPTLSVEEVENKVRFIPSGFSIEPDFRITEWN